jgi:hypothetical protein
MVKRGDKRTFWWICQSYEHHVWQSQIWARIKSNGACPICSSLRLKPGKTLLEVCPSIAKEWHEKKNKGLKPSDFAPQSKKSAFWRCCKNSRHVWEAKISARTTHFSGCPFCKEQKI